MACVQVTVKPSHHILPACLPAFHRMSVSGEPRPWAVRLLVEVTLFDKQQHSWPM